MRYVIPLLVLSIVISGCSSEPDTVTKDEITSAEEQTKALDSSTATENEIVQKEDSSEPEDKQADTPSESASAEEGNTSAENRNDASVENSEWGEITSISELPYEGVSAHLDATELGYGLFYASMTA